MPVLIMPLVPGIFDSQNHFFFLCRCCMAMEVLCVSISPAPPINYRSLVPYSCFPWYSIIPYNSLRFSYLPNWHLKLTFISSYDQKYHVTIMCHNLVTINYLYTYILLVDLIILYHINFWILAIFHIIKLIYSLI